MYFNPIMLPGPGNGRPMNAQGMLAHILAQTQARQLPMPIRQAPNMNAIHQQVSQLANRVHQSRQSLGQAQPYQTPLPQAGGGPALPPTSNPFLQLPQSPQLPYQMPNPAQSMQDHGQPAPPGFGPGSPGFFVPGFHQLPTPLHSFPYYQ